MAARIRIRRGLLAALFFLCSCGKTTDCDYIDKDPVGDLQQDIVGCWQTFGIETLVVYHFASDGTYRYIEPSGSLFSSGQTIHGSYLLTDGVLNLQDGSPPSHVHVTTTSLVLEENQVNMRRAVCRGYGFEHRETCQ